MRPKFKLKTLERRTKTMHKICSKSTIKTSERCPFIRPEMNRKPIVFWWFQGEQKYILLASLLLTSNTLSTIFSTLMKRCPLLLTFSTVRKTFSVLISTVFINNFEHTLFLMSLLLTLNIFHIFFECAYCWTWASKYMPGRLTAHYKNLYFYVNFGYYL